MKLLLVSKDDDIVSTVREYANRNRYELATAADVREASEAIGSREFDAVLMDCSIRPIELINLAGERVEELSETVVLLLGPVDQTQRENLSRRLSAHYAIDKPLRQKAFYEMMRRVAMRSTIVRQVGLIGRSPEMEETVQTIMQIGPTPITVLITGESGTGKEIIGRAIHAVSRRSNEPFLAVNCAALAEGVLESELFGHEKGSFTGATARRSGMFERANNGTIFLDEIGEIPHSTQIRLLRVLEEREITRVGGTDVIPVDVRVIAATNSDLGAQVEKGAFRRDLYYRIKVLDIFVPPLRKRPEDIPILIDYLARVYTKENRVPPRRFSSEAKEMLSQLRWSGNVRELRNFVEGCLALTDSSRLRSDAVGIRVIGPGDIPAHLLESGNRYPPNPNPMLPVPTDKSASARERELLYRTLLEIRKDITEIKEFLFEGAGFEPARTTARIPYMREVIPIEEGAEQTLEEIERQAMIDALDHTHGNRRKAAELLGIGERTLYRKIRQYGLGRKT